MGARVGRASCVVGTVEEARFGRAAGAGVLVVGGGVVATVGIG